MHALAHRASDDTLTVLEELVHELLDGSSIPLSGSLASAVSSSISPSFTPSTISSIAQSAPSSLSTTDSSIIDVVSESVTSLHPKSVEVSSTDTDSSSTSSVTTTTSTVHSSSSSPTLTSVSHSSSTSLQKDDTTSSQISTSQKSTASTSDSVSSSKASTSLATEKVSSSSVSSQASSTPVAQPVPATTPSSSSTQSSVSPTGVSSAGEVQRNPSQSPNPTQSELLSPASAKDPEPTNSGSVTLPENTSGNGFIATSSSSQHAASTFSTPVSITVTNSHSTFVTTPAFVTSVSVETGSNGKPDQTFTSVFANPTKTTDTESNLSGGSFFDNKGNIAAVVIAVLAVISAISLGIFCFRRQKRRWQERARRHSTEWSRQQMLEQPTTYGAIRRSQTARDDPERHLMAPSLRSAGSASHVDTTLRPTNSLHSSEAHSSALHTGPGALGLTGVLGEMPKHEGPFSDYNRYPSFAVDARVRDSFPEKLLVAPPIQTESKSSVDATTATSEGGRSSPTPSTPSIYPPSLPAVQEKEEDDYLFYQHETRPRPLPKLPTAPPKVHVDENVANPFSDPVENDLFYKAAPPRVETGRVWRPLTPPDSVSGESTATTPVTPESAKASDPFTNAFLGRRVSKFERPARNPLRLSATSATMGKWDDLTRDTTTTV